MKHPFFQTYYDHLQSDKDYDGEARAVVALYRAHSKRALKSILDVGCGTGNHSIALARLGHRVVGVDVDREMVRVAKAKQKGLKGLDLLFSPMPRRETSDRGFELSVSLFNVVNYIGNIGDLILFFRSIHERLRPGGIYIFDVWNGVAALRDNPRRKQRTMRSAEGTIRLKLRPETDLMGQSCVLHYDLVMDRPQGSEKGDHRIVHTLWTPKCLRDCLDLSGFDVLGITPFMSGVRRATAKDWKVMFVCRKSARRSRIVRVFQGAGERR